MPQITHMAAKSTQPRRLMRVLGGTAGGGAAGLRARELPRAVEAGHTAVMKAQRRRYDAAMADIAIRPIGAREYDVELNDGGRRSSHRVTVPERLIAELGMQDGVEDLVRES